MPHYLLILNDLDDPLANYCRDTGIPKAQVLRFAVRNFLESVGRIEPVPGVDYDRFRGALAAGRKPDSPLDRDALCSGRNVVELKPRRRRRGRTDPAADKKPIA